MICAERIRLRHAEREDLSTIVHKGLLREAQFSDGKYKDVLVMSVLRSEWSSEA